MKMIKTLTRLLIGFSALSAAEAATQSLPMLSDIQQLTVGANHACALGNDGGVKCWGDNEFGQLGDGTAENRFLPVPVVGLNRGVSQIDAGDRHTCAVMTSGGIKCWGQNSLGETGDGTTAFFRRTPVDTVDVSTAVEVTAGSGSTCARLSDNGVRCWGFNGDGQLGTGDRENANTPRAVFGDYRATAISAGFAETCAIGVGGGVACWGIVDRVCNNFGCSQSGVTTPTSIPGLASGVDAISSGLYWNCAVMSAGGVQCFGDNYGGQLGNPEEPDPDPRELFPIAGAEGAIDAVSAGREHGCIALANGQAKCWGRNGGRLGDGTGAYRYPAVTVVNLNNVEQVEAGHFFSCALTATGEVYCWGSNVQGQLGNNEPLFRNRPLAVEGLASGVAELTVGGYHNCARLNNGEVRCWGDNGDGQFGNGTFEDSLVPVSIPALSGQTRQLSAGGRHTCAIDNSNGLRCMGDNAEGQLGNGETGNATELNEPTPQAVVGLGNGVLAVEAGEFHTCARIDGNNAKCWGLNLSYQIGNAQGSLSEPEPETVVNMAGQVRQIAVGGSHSCAIKTDNSLECWGNNGDGQIGNDSFDDAFLPTPVENFASGASDVALGFEHSCAIRLGGLECWGRGSGGQLGTGFTTSTIRFPVSVAGLASGVAAVDAGWQHTCAVTTAGAAMCWGDNSFGEVGNYSFERQTAPVMVVGLHAGVAEIGTGDAHTCARTTAGGVFCWGSNALGQLGINGRDRTVPGAVLDDPPLFKSGFQLND